MDLETFTYALIDFRGYGKSKEIEGQYTALEAVKDVLEVINSLGWDQFHLLGFAMA